MPHGLKLGLSSYSFRPLMQAGQMRIEDVFAWLQKHGGEHLELASLSVAPEGGDLGYELGADAEMLDRLKTASSQTGIPLSGICIGADFIGAERRTQIERTKRYVETCASLGLRHLRHDVVMWSRRQAELGEFEREFAGIVDACAEVAEHAARHDVIASVEDHGFFMNGSERISRLLHAVASSNFRMTLDIGNFLCVDEDPLTGTRAGLPLASFVHLKDFYVRRESPGPGWLQTHGKQYIRGSVFGYGDLPVELILRDILASGYQGFVSLEYEGNEPTQFGCETGLNNIKRILGKIAG